MSEQELALGTLALLRKEGKPGHALADLYTQVVGMCGFLAKTGSSQEQVLEVFDELHKSGREALIDIMEEDARDAKT